MAMFLKLQTRHYSCVTPNTIDSAGHLHDPGGRAVAMDVVGVLHELPAVLAGLRADMVADRLQPRRPGASEFRQSDLHALRPGYPQLHQLLLILRRDAAHHRVMKSYNHSIVSLSQTLDDDVDDAGTGRSTRRTNARRRSSRCASNP